jgi:predicted phage terminase large subunit-like protein
MSSPPSPASPLAPQGLPAIPSLEEIRAEQARRATDRLAEQCRRSLARFIREAWHVLEPTTALQWNWHIDAIAEHVQAMLEDWEAASKATPEARPPQRIQNLVVNVPPGTMKSLIVSVFAPAWWWLRHPSWRAIFVSGNPRVTSRDSVKRRDLIESEWYQQTFRPTWSMAEDQNAKLLFKNTSTGFMQAATVGQKITGDRGDAIFVDDANDAQEVASLAHRQSVNDWWDQAAANRLSDPVCGLRLVIGQRLHEEDLPGHILAEEGTGWQLLCIPMEAEEDPDDPDAVLQRSRTGLNFRDPRTTVGELLFPQRFPEHVLEGERTRLGSAGYAGQMQQRPAPASGLIFQREWWRFWRRASEPDVAGYELRTEVLPDSFDEMQLSWDCAFKKTVDSDRVAGGTWAKKGARKYILDLFWDRASFTETCTALKAQAEKWPEAHAKLVEAKANGDAVIDVLNGTVSGLIAVDPQGGKEARAAATSPQVEAGNVLLPLHAKWRDPYIDEHAGFPRGAHDDTVDQQSQALIRWNQKPPSFEDLKKSAVPWQRKR